MKLDGQAERLSRITLQLSPPDLGLIHIVVESREGDLLARFHATHPFVHTWLESNAATLRSHLAGAGFESKLDLQFQDFSFTTTADHQRDGRGSTPNWTDAQPDTGSFARQEDSGPRAAASQSAADPGPVPSAGLQQLADWRSSFDSRSSLEWLA